MRMLAACAGALLAAAAAASGGEPAASFTTKPAASGTGEKTTVAFAVSGKTDVEVAILDAKGEVVRHLAAGVLGAENPPPAPLKAGLAQSLEWDGKDDYGRQVSGVSVQVSGAQPDTRNLTPDTSFQVRVRLGMGAKLDKIVGGDPCAFWTDSSGQGDHAQWRITGLEAKSDGNVYVLGTITSTGLPALRQYDARGNYRRTVFPPPAGKPLDDVKGWGVNVREDGTYVLRASYGWCTDVPQWGALCGGNGGGRTWTGGLLATPDSGTLCIAKPLSEPNGRAQNETMTVGTDSTVKGQGRVVDAQPVPQELCKALYSACPPDGKTQYLSGFRADGQVWKVDLATRKASAFFALDEKELAAKRGAIGHRTTNPHAALQGLATDAEGRLVDAGDGLLTPGHNDGLYPVLFDFGDNIHNAGLVEEARRCLNNIVAKYPKTEWAGKAREELGRL